MDFQYILDSMHNVYYIDTAVYTFQNHILHRLYFRIFTVRIEFTPLPAIVVQMTKYIFLLLLLIGDSSVDDLLHFSAYTTNR
jgi:hypothetical protein